MGAWLGIGGPTLCILHEVNLSSDPLCCLLFADMLFTFGLKVVVQVENLIYFERLLLKIETTH